MPWYKGNLHAHTTRSDGKLPPQDVLAAYKAAGYDFAALTDHWTFGKGGTHEGMTVLSGLEYDVNLPADLQTFHIVCIGACCAPALAKSPALTPQDVINAIHDKGGLAIHAHPAWSMQTVEAAMRYTGFDGCEIYNTVCGAKANVRPDSSLFVDQMAARGRRYPVMAADDAHWYDGEQCVSYLMVDAQDAAPASLLAAIRAGRFYASQGPRLTCVTLEGGVVRLECSPARKIAFLSNTCYTKGRVVYGDGLTSAEYAMGGEDSFVRAEVTDMWGRRAWSQILPAAK